MRIRFEGILLGLVAACVCTIGFSSTLLDAGQALSFRGPGESGVIFAATDQAGDPAWFDVVGGSESVTQQPLLLAKQDKVAVCHVLPNGRGIKQNIPIETFKKLKAKHPHEWLLGKCKDGSSPV